MCAEINQYDFLIKVIMTEKPPPYLPPESTNENAKHTDCSTPATAMRSGSEVPDALVLSARIDLIWNTIFGKEEDRIILDNARKDGASVLLIGDDLRYIYDNLDNKDKNVEHVSKIILAWIPGTNPITLRRNITRFNFKINSPININVQVLGWPVYRDEMEEHMPSVAREGKVPVAIFGSKKGGSFADIDTEVIITLCSVPPSVEKKFRKNPVTHATHEV